MPYLHDINSSLYSVALTQANVTTTVTGGVVDMVLGDGSCNLIVASNAANQTYLVANVLQSAASTGGFTAITAATIAATTVGATALTFQRDSRYLCVRFDFAGTGNTGLNSILLEQKKLSNG